MKKLKFHRMVSGCTTFFCVSFCARGVSDRSFLLATARVDVVVKLAKFRVDVLPSVNERTPALLE